jgi:4-hydroxybenzoate polyprenyltransferase
MKQMNDAANSAIDRHVMRSQPGPKDQVSATRRTLKQMNETADRAIDEQVARSTPMTPKK